MEEENSRHEYFWPDEVKRGGILAFEDIILYWDDRNAVESCGEYLTRLCYKPGTDVYKEMVKVLFEEKIKALYKTQPQ